MKRRLCGREVFIGPKAIPDSQAVQFTPIRFPVIAGAGKGRVISGFLSCTPAGPRMEIAWDHNHLYAIQSKDGLKELWSTENDGAQVRSVVYDGRYAWATVYRGSVSPWLLVIDPQSETVQEVSVDSGLPLQPEEKMPPRGQQEMLVAPVSPGCACVAGSFGRAWIALVKYDPQAVRPLSVDVFHEARRTWDGADPRFPLDPGAVFQPTCMTVLTDAAGDHRRIFIGRFDGGHTRVGNYPLLVDPVARSVSVVEADLFRNFFAIWPLTLRTFGVHQGAVYFFGMGPRAQRHLYRIGFPELKPVVVSDDAPNGCVVSYCDRLHIVGPKWWRLRADDGLDDMGNVPWSFEENYGRSRWIELQPSAPTELRPLLREICLSRYYGLLAITHNRSNTNLNDLWTTYQVSIREDKVVPAVPLEDEESRKMAEFKKRLATASEAIRREPRDAKAWYQRAIVYQQGKLWQKSVDDSTEAIRLDPRFAQAYFARGTSRTFLGKPDEEIADYTEAIRLDPLFSPAYFRRGFAPPAQAILTAPKPTSQGSSA